MAVLITVIYSNTLQVPWVLDDPPNITNNPPLQINNLLPESLIQTFFAKPFAAGELYRPVANFSFALNWYLGQDNPYGYHLVNLMVHIITALFLLKTSFILLKVKFPNLSEQDTLFIALLSATLWAINPIQIQAITYIVQRMASMAAMFFIISVYFYAKARLTDSNKQLRSNLLRCLLFFLLAVNCKENAVTLIPSLLLFEIFFFYKRDDPYSRFFLWLLFIANILFIGAGIYYVVSHNYLTNFFGPVGSRPFSFAERLLTQPSVLLFYLSLIFFPTPDRLSIDHSFPLSTSLFSPLTTLPSILIVLMLITFSVVKYRRYPLICFAILFFFINHMVESSIIPLELVFEHRNYLPTLFLFLPVAAGAKNILDIIRAAHFRIAHVTFISFISLLIAAIGFGTYKRNEVWKSEEGLWRDALPKAYNNARPFSKLGEIYGWRKEASRENLEIAVSLYKQALEKETPRTSFKPAILGNIGKLYMPHGELESAARYFRESLKLNPNFVSSRFGLAQTLTLQGKFEESLLQINEIFRQKHLYSQYFNHKTLVLLWLDKPQKALASNSWALDLAPPGHKLQYFYNSGVALSKAGHYSQGLWFLKQCLDTYPQKLHILASIIENRINAQDMINARKYAAKLVDRYSLATIQNEFHDLQTNYAIVPIDIDLIYPIIQQNFSTRYRENSPITSFDR